MLARIIYCVTVILALTQGIPSARANDPFARQGTDAGAAFLPVEQAYQVAVNIESGPDQKHLTLDWVIAPGYFLYQERMAIQATTPDGSLLGTKTEHTPGIMKYDDYFERETEVFYGQAALKVAFSTAPPSTLTLSVESQGCADAGLCYPPRQQSFHVDLRTGIATETPHAASTQKPSTAVTASTEASSAPSTQKTNTHSLVWVLFTALLGGLMLNLMPCVFPVLSLKIFAMTGHGDHSREVRMESWIYVLGVVLSFVVVAGIMLALRAGGESVGWGFQLQEPLFVSLLLYLFFVLALSFSGIVHISGSLMGIGQKLIAGNGYRSAFFTGILAVIVASPCSVPFMGVAVGYAITRSVPEGLLIFGVLGLGMSLPFLMLAYWPQMMRRLPAPGDWMERLKQFLAFPLYATCLWLLYVLGEQGGHMAIIWALGGLMLLVMAGWLWRDADAHPSEKILAVIVLCCALVLPHFLVLHTCNLSNDSTDTSGTDSEPYTAMRLVELRAQGKPVFINLTAAWCITCLVNERVALSQDNVKAHIKAKGITYLKGDWTNRDPEITSLLQQFDRSGVPLYLYFPPGRSKDIVVLPQILTEKTVISALQ